MNKLGEVMMSMGRSRGLRAAPDAPKRKRPVEHATPAEVREAREDATPAEQVEAAEAANGRETDGDDADGVDPPAPVIVAAPAGFRVVAGPAGVHLDAAETVVTGNLTCSGTVCPTAVVVTAQPDAPAAAPNTGTFWCTASPTGATTPMFTDDLGVTVALSAGGGGDGGGGGTGGSSGGGGGGSAGVLVNAPGRRLMHANPFAPGGAFGNSVVFGSDSLSDSGPSKQVRLQFMSGPTRGALRAGRATGAQWDPGRCGATSVALGLDTEAAGAEAVVAGGRLNRAQAACSAVLGGEGNSVDGAWGAALGGQGNEVTGQHGTALGQRAAARHANALVWADGSQPGLLESPGPRTVTLGATGGFIVRGDGSSTPAYRDGQAYVDVREAQVTGDLGVGGAVSVGGAVDAAAVWLRPRGHSPAGQPGPSTLWVSASTPDAATSAWFTDSAGVAHPLASNAFCNVGRLTVQAVRAGHSPDSTLVFGGQTTEGPGTRLVFDHPNGALRAGTVTGAQWDAGERGVGSVALGVDGVASGRAAVVGGGAGNAARGRAAVVAGGQANEASGRSAVVGGGSGNVASGHSSVVPGGTGNRATARSALAAGEAAAATHAHSLVWGDGATGRASAAEREVTLGALGGLRVLARADETPGYHPGTGHVFLDAATVTATGRLVAGTLRSGRLVLDAPAAPAGQAGPSGPAGPAGPAAPAGPAGTAGTLWVRPDGAAVYTDPAGADTVLAGPGSGGVWTADGGLVRPDPLRSTAGDSLVFGSDALGHAGPAGCTRLLFDRETASFRAGRAGSTQWDDRGAHSVALGLDGSATGSAAVALGAGGRASGEASTVCGGANVAAAGHAAAIGGHGNAVDAAAVGGFVGGGGRVGGGATAGNMVLGARAAVLGGTDNHAAGDDAVVLGGRAGRATGMRSVVLGGSANRATDAYALAAGVGSHAGHPHSLVWSDSVPRSSVGPDTVTLGARGGLRVLGAGAGSPAFRPGDAYLDVPRAVVTGDLHVNGIVCSAGHRVAYAADHAGPDPAGPAGTFWVDPGGRPMFTSGGVARALESPFRSVACPAGAAGPAGRRVELREPAAELAFELALGPTAGPGARMLFRAGAFRAGRVTGAHWDAVAPGSTALGTDTEADGEGSTVGGGLLNVASGDHAVVSGGRGNAAVGCGAVASGGRENSAVGDYAVVAGGRGNRADARGAVSGGSANAAAGHGAVGGGAGNAAGGHGAVGGGTANAAGDHAVVGGGRGNIASGVESCVAGGRDNRAEAALSAVAGGRANVASGGCSAVLGGADNRADNARAVVCGGEGNRATGVAAFVGAGGAIGVVPMGPNAASGQRSAVLCGTGNSATASDAAVLAGSDCTASGTCSVAAGSECAALGAESVALGRAARAQGSQSVAIGDGPVAGAAGCIAIGRAVAHGAPDGGTAGGSSLAIGRAGAYDRGAVAIGFDVTADLRCVAVGNAVNCLAADGVALGTNVSVQLGHAGACVLGDGDHTASISARRLVAGFADGYTLWTDTGRTLGARLGPGDTAWSVACDRDLKENLRPLVGALDRVLELPIYEFNYRGVEPARVCRGPTAQDWHRLFPSSKDPLTIDTLDLDGVALAAIRELAQVVRRQGERIDHLERALLAR